MATIEDIAELQRVGTKETYILFVDSEKRDKSVWNNQSEYDIEFASPFRNVYGIDILDLAIPRTEYIIDTFDNVLTFQIGTEPIQQLTITPGDYAIEQLIQVLNESLVSNNKSIFVSGVTDPINIQGKLSFSSDYPFNFNMSKSTIRSVLGFNNPILALNNPDIGVNYNIPTAYVDGVTDDTFYSVLNTSQIVVQIEYSICIWKYQCHRGSIRFLFCHDDRNVQYIQSLDIRNQLLSDIYEHSRRCGKLLRSILFTR